MNRSLVTQLAAGLLLAAVLLAALQWWSSRTGAAAETAPVAAPPAPTPAADRAGPPPAPPPGYDLLSRLQGRALEVVLVAAGTPVPERCAPVFKITGGGAIQIPLPPPLPSGVEAAEWPAAGILLPAPGLAALRPEQRAALLALLSALHRGRGWRRSQLHWSGPPGSIAPGELEQLRRWVQ